MFNIHATEFDSPLSAEKAKAALEILTEAYPGYSWKVDAKQGVVFVQLLDLNLRPGWGFMEKARNLDHDAAVFKKKVKAAAGELLERCHLSRVRNQGEQIKVFEGVPERFQPR